EANTPAEHPIAQRIEAHVWSAKIMKRIATIGIVTILLALGGFRTARADAAPPVPAPGTGIEGQYPTNVQMVSEDVLMTLQDDMRVQVVASFELRNQGTSTEAFDVRFPVGVFDGYDKIVRVDNFTAWTDGRLADVHEEQEDCLCGAPMDY